MDIQSKYDAVVATGDSEALDLFMAENMEALLEAGIVGNPVAAETVTDERPTTQA